MGTISSRERTNIDLIKLKIDQYLETVCINEIVSHCSKLFIDNYTELNKSNNFIPTKKIETIEDLVVFTEQMLNIVLFEDVQRSDFQYFKSNELYIAQMRPLKGLQLCNRILDQLVPCAEYIVKKDKYNCYTHNINTKNSGYNQYKTYQIKNSKYLQYAQYYRVNNHINNRKTTIKFFKIIKCNFRLLCKNTQLTDTHIEIFDKLFNAHIDGINNLVSKMNNANSSDLEVLCYGNSTTSTKNVFDMAKNNISHTYIIIRQFLACEPTDISKKT